MALHFEPEEFEARRLQVLEEMARRKLDALLLFAPESHYWLTGYDTFGYCFFQCLVCTRNGFHAPHPLRRPAPGAPHVPHQEHRRVDGCGRRRPRRPAPRSPQRSRPARRAARRRIRHAWADRVERARSGRRAAEFRHARGRLRSRSSASPAEKPCRDRLCPQGSDARRRRARCGAEAHRAGCRRGRDSRRNAGRRPSRRR